jgi:hypothetical protein
MIFSLILCGTLGSSNKRFKTVLAFSGILEELLIDSLKIDQETAKSVLILGSEAITNLIYHLNQV